MKTVVVRPILISLIRNSLCLEFVTAGAFNAGVGVIRSSNSETSYRHSGTVCFESYHLCRYIQGYLNRSSKSPGMLHYVDWWTVADDAKYRSAFILIVKGCRQTWTFCVMIWIKQVWVVVGCWTARMKSPGSFFNVCHPEVFNTYINIPWCIKPTKLYYVYYNKHKVLLCLTDTSLYIYTPGSC